MRKPKPKMGIDKSLKAKALADKKHILITVHGTFANDDADIAPPPPDDTDIEVEDRWWQIGSGFLTSLQSKVKDVGGAEFSILPFHWDGQNADTSRLKAARKLAKDMNELERAGQEFSVVSHSHGGNVFARSLHICRTRFFESKPALNNLKSYISVGSPFFKYRRKKSQIAMMLIVFIMALMWIMLSGYAIIQELDDGDALKAVIAIALLFGSIYIVGSTQFSLKFSTITVCLAAITHSVLVTSSSVPIAEYIFMIVLSFLNFGSLMLGWSLLKMIFARFIEQRGNAANLKRIGLDKKLLSIISHRDEAMALLRNSVTPKVKLVQANTLDKRFSSLLDTLGIIIIIPIFLSFVTEFNLFKLNTYPKLFKLETHASVINLVKDAADYDLAIFLGLIAIIGAAGIYLSLQLLKLVIRYSGINHIIARFINNGTIKTLRGAAFGDDSEWKITGVSKTPDHLDKDTLHVEVMAHDNFGGIDEEEVLNSADRLHTLLEQLNVETPDKLMTASADGVRAQISGYAKPKKDLQDQLKEAVLKMLYHNAYFRDEKVIELIAKKIVKAQDPIPET